MSQDTHTSAHAQAASAYGTHAQKHSTDPREVEARVLLKSAGMLNDLKTSFSDAPQDLIQQTLKYNRQIWMMFYDTALENKSEGHPDQLRDNIINLARFVFKRETEILAKPDVEKLNALININRELAAGLMGSAEKTN